MDDTFSVCVLPFATQGGDDSQGLWARQLASLLAEGLAELGIASAWAPMVARTEQGPAWLQDDEARDAEAVARLLGDTPARLAVDGALAIHPGTCRAVVRVLALPTAEARHGPWMLEEADPRALLRRMRRVVADALGVEDPGHWPLLEQAREAGAFDAWLADRDTEALRALSTPDGAPPEPGARHRWRFLLAAATDPAFVHARGQYVQRAIAHARHGAVDDAADAMQALEAAVGASAELDGAFAEMLIAGKRWDAAEDRLRAGIARDARWAWGHHRLGHLRLLAEDHAEAVRWLRLAHRLDPPNPWTRIWLAVALDELGEHVEADAHWDAVLHDPDAAPRAVQVASTTRQVAHARRLARSN